MTSQSFSIMIADENIHVTFQMAETVTFVPILVVIPRIFIDLDQ